MGACFAHSHSCVAQDETRSSALSQLEPSANESPCVPKGGLPAPASAASSSSVSAPIGGHRSTGSIAAHREPIGKASL
eukprot:9500123-Pyramimonas_sp.AAC.1